MQRRSHPVMLKATMASITAVAAMTACTPVHEEPLIYLCSGPQAFAAPTLVSALGVPLRKAQPDSHRAIATARANTADPGRSVIVAIAPVAEQRRRLLDRPPCPCDPALVDGEFGPSRVDRLP